MIQLKPVQDVTVDYYGIYYCDHYLQTYHMIIFDLLTLFGHFYKPIYKYSCVNVITQVVNVVKV